MRERKTITEANALVDAADKFDDMYLRIEALANHAHDLIKYAGEEQLVGDWWQSMQGAMQKMQGITDEIRQPKLPGMSEGTEHNTSTLDAVFNEHDFYQLEHIWPALEAGDKQEALRQINHYLNKGKNRAWWGDLKALDIKIDPNDVENSQVMWSKPIQKDMGESAQEESDANVQKENQMENIDDMIANLSKLAGLNVVEGSKPDFLDVDKDGNKKEPFKDAVDDKEEDKDIKESVELDECGMPMAVAYDDATDSYPGEVNGPAEQAGDMYKLDVKTANKTMSFITDNPEEIIQVLKASGIDVKSTEATGFQPPAQVPVPQVNSTPASPAPAEEKTDEAVGDKTRSSTGGTITQTATGQVHKAGSGNYGGANDDELDAKDEDEDEEDKKVAESIAILRKMSGFAPVSVGKFGNSVAGPKGDPRDMGDTIDFALAGQGNAKSGRGDKGLRQPGTIHQDAMIAI